jgi:hypothetical protein
MSASGFYSMSTSYRRIASDCRYSTVELEYFNDLEAS